MDANSYENIIYPIVIICVIPWVISGIYGLRVMATVFKEKPEVFAEWKIRKRIEILEELEKRSPVYVRAKKKTIKWIIISASLWLVIVGVLACVAYFHRLI